MEPEDGYDYGDVALDQQAKRLLAKRNRDLQSALQECPIRTRYVPRDHSARGEADGSQDPSPRSEGLTGRRSGSSHRQESQDAFRMSSSMLGASVVQSPSRRTSELRMLGSSLLLSIESAPHTFQEPPERAAAEMYTAALALDENDDRAYKVDNEARRNKQRVDSMQTIKEVCGMNASRNPYDRFRDQGQLYHGAMAARRREVVDVPAGPVHETLEADARARRHALLDNIPARMSNNDGGAELKKHRIEAKQLEEFWCHQPGDEAIRRIPEQHECVYDFADSRISLPRYFGEQARHGERRCEAGQLLEIQEAGSAVTLRTRAPRRCMLSTPATLDEICDVAALDARQKPTAEPDDGGKRGLQHTSYNHLHQQKRPPDKKAWQLWRELQAKKRMQEQQEEVETWMRQRSGHGDGGRDDGPPMALADDVAPEESSESSRDASPARSPGRGGRRSAVSTSRSAGALEAVAWDARPPPTLEEAGAFFDFVFTPRQAEALKRGLILGGMAAETRRNELTWKLRSTDGRGLDLDLSVDVDGLEEPAALESAEEDDDAFWRDFFEPVPTGFQQPVCLDGACGC